MYIHDALFSKVDCPITMGILFYLVSVADDDGNVYMSYADIGRTLGYEKTRVFRCVQKLTSINAIRLLTFDNVNGGETVVQRSCNKKCVINVCKIAAYKSGETLMKRNSNGGATKKGDNSRVDINSLSVTKAMVSEVFFANCEMDAAFKKWLAYKRERKQTYKPRGLAAAKNRLEQLSGGNPCLATEIVEFSIANNYSGLFAPKQLQDDEKRQRAINAKIREIFND